MSKRTPGGRPKRHFVITPDGRAHEIARGGRQRLLAGAWIDYQVNVVPDDAGSAQVFGTKASFYAGASAALAIAASARNDDEAAGIVADLLAELEEFIMEGVARGNGS